MAKAKSKHVGGKKNTTQKQNKDFSITDVLALGGTKVCIPIYLAVNNTQTRWLTFEKKRFVWAIICTGTRVVPW